MFFKGIPCKNRLNEIEAIRKKLLNYLYKPENSRDGFKILNQKLKGPIVSQYYGSNDSVPTFDDFKEWFPHLKLIDPKEDFRLKMLESRRKRNKTAPLKKKK